MSLLAEALALLPAGLQGLEAPRVQALPGGAGRNEVLRIDTGNGRFVWRRRRPPIDRPGSAAHTELLAHRLAAAAGLAPGILAAAPDAEWILMQHVDAEPWKDAAFDDLHNVQRLGARLAELHGLPVPAELPSADAAAMARGYVTRIAQRDAVAAAAAQPVVERVELLSERLADLGEGRVLVHGDLMASNLLGEKPVMVDWEYAQAADPTWDCACLLSYYPQLETCLPQLLASMRLSGPQISARLALQRERFALLHRLWDRAYDLT